MFYYQIKTGERGDSHHHQRCLWSCRDKVGSDQFFLNTFFFHLFADLTDKEQTQMANLEAETKDLSGVHKLRVRRRIKNIIFEDKLSPSVLM